MRSTTWENDPLNPSVYTSPLPEALPEMYEMRLLVLSEQRCNDPGYQAWVAGAARPPCWTEIRFKAEAKPRVSALRSGASAIFRLTFPLSENVDHSRLAYWCRRADEDTARLIGMVEARLGCVVPRPSPQGLAEDLSHLEWLQVGRLIGVGESLHSAIAMVRDRRL